ncbi:MAG TPA: endonuclease III [Acidobacteria bacterium]|nr:endonuclease III [Acidobacteriota bacterium]
MTRHEKALRIREILDRLFPEVDIPLSHEDPFTLLVAVLLSAQTTDKMVNEVTPALFARAPTPAALAALEEEEIRWLIRRIGLSATKAKNLKRLAALLGERHGGSVPRTLAELEALPGVGHKTASVVLSQAFGLAAFPVDTHIHRLATRWGLTGGKNVETTEADLKKVFPEESWGRLHLQIIYFGRTFCPALYHDLDDCPICAWAASKARKEAERRRNLEVRRR